MVGAAAGLHVGAEVEAILAGPRGRGLDGPDLTDPSRGRVGHDRGGAVPDPHDAADEDDRPWMLEAKCLDADPEAFFPEKGGSTREAKRICNACPVRSECLEYALASDERFGIWGGMSERERRRLKKVAS